MSSSNALPTRKSSRRLSAERICEAAIALLDHEGPAALTARRLAAALECKAMSLYNHVRNMDEVQDLVVDHLLSGLLTDTPRGEPLAEVQDEALRFLALAEAHPHAFSYIATRRWRTPGALALADRLVSRLAETGLSMREALRQARVIGAYLNGAGLGLASWQLIPKSTEDAAAPSADKALASDAASVKDDLVVGLQGILQRIG